MQNKSTGYVSASQIGQFIFCPVSYRLSKVEGFDKFSGQNIYMLYGSAMHEALAENFKYKIKHGTEMPLKDCVKVFNDYFDKELPTTILMKGASPTVMKLTAENVLASYLKNVSPNLHPTHVELKFDIELKNYPVRILGYIDLITKDDVIRDHKTVGLSGIKDWTQNKVDDSLQLTMYALAFRKLFNRREEGLSIDLVPRDNNPKFSSKRTYRTDDQIRTVINLAVTIQKMKDNNLYFANLDNCRGCPYNKVCPKK